MGADKIDSYKGKDFVRFCSKMQPQLLAGIQESRPVRTEEEIWIRPKGHLTQHPVSHSGNRTPLAGGFAEVSGGRRGAR